MKNRDMKKLLLLFALILSGIAYSQVSQQASETHLFAQGIFDLQSEDEMRDLQSEMQQNPNIEVVRLDHHSGRFFILTRNINTLTEAELRSWFGSYGTLPGCIQIGVHGVDMVKPFPFTDCQ